MGLLKTQIKLKDLRKRTIIQFDENEDWKPYLVINTDRADFFLCGKEIVISSRDFRMCTDKIMVTREQNYWRKLHRQKEYAAELRRTYWIAPEQFQAIDNDYFLNSAEVTESEFIAEYQKRNRG